MSVPADLVRIGPDGRRRCWWCGEDPRYVAYHDDEWGRTPDDDVRLFEKLCLEGFQAGLSWLTILRKRDAFRRAFAGFDPSLVAVFADDDVRRLLGDAGIVRHRGKIESTINNAGRMLDLIGAEGSFRAYLTRFEPAEHRRPRGLDDLRAASPESTALSRDLKRRGFSFVGPTTMYAFMQAMGLVDDHAEMCDSPPPQ